MEMGDIDLGNMDLEKVCTNLGFQVTPYKFRGRYTTNLVEISRNDSFITIVSNRYKLLPNEVALAIGEEISSQIGAKRVSTIEDDNSIIIHYLQDELTTESGKIIRAGFYITNSVDERMSFRIKSFLIYNKEVIYLGTLISGVVRRHTKNIDIDMEKILEIAKEAVKIASQFALQIDDWSKISVSDGYGIGIMESIRTSLIPNIYRPTYLLKPTKRVKEHEIPSTPNNLSLFRMYMDTIHCINNPPTGKLSEKTRIQYFNMLHKAIFHIIGNGKYKI